jgi:hypothetical protein
MKNRVPSEENKNESARLKALWDSNKKISQAEFGKRYSLGNQSYITQCLNGKVVLNLKAGMVFAWHLNCLLKDFSVRLDDELARIVKFDMDQKCLQANKKLFRRGQK